MEDPIAKIPKDNSNRGFAGNKLWILLVIIALWIVSAIAVGRYVGKKVPAISQTNGKLEQTLKVVDEESAIIEAYNKISPSVVSIAVENRQIFDPFFGTQQQEKQSGIGTGFVVTKDGLILTNKHVVSLDSEKYIAIIKQKDGSDKKYPIVKIHRDPFNDLAIVKVDAGDLEPADLGDSDKVKIGQSVIAVGNALGRFQNSVTAGIISGLGRGVSPVNPSTGVAERLDDLIQTDAAINPGNSGGPLVNLAGQVIGIDSAVASAENIGFAIKINVAKNLLSDFQQSGGKISRPFLGVSYTHLSKDVAILNELPEGEYVREVVPGSSAQKADIKVGDVITHFDDQRLSDQNDLSKKIREKKVGDSVKLKVFRDGQTRDVTMNLGEAPNQ